MDLYGTIANKLNQLHQLPESRRQSIFFSFMAVFVLVGGIFAVISTKSNLASLQNSFEGIDLSQLSMDQGPFANIDTALETEGNSEAKKKTRRTKSEKTESKNIIR